MSGVIGSLTFPLMVGDVPQIYSGIEVLEKPGRNYFMRRDIGLRCPDFVVRTRGHYSTQALARADFKSATQLIADVAQTFQKDGRNYTTAPEDGIKVIVMDVKPQELALRTCIAGTTDRWELILNWTLRPIPA